MQPLNHVMHNPFVALVELCVLGGQDHFCPFVGVGVQKLALIFIKDEDGI